MAKHFFDTAGARIHYEVKGDGFPVVLIHAGIVNMGMWDDQMKALAQDYRLIRYDIRGWGKSEGVNTDFSNHGDLHTLLNYLEVEQAILIGASFGGSVAIDFALVHPEIVKALVLVGPGLGGYEFTNEGFERELEALRAAYSSGDKALSAEYAARIWIDGQGRARESVSVPIREKALEMILHTFELSDDGDDGHELEPEAITRLNEIDKPVQIILGEHDQQDIFNISQLVRGSISQAELLVIKDAAHLPNMERSDEFNWVVLDFLDHLLAE